MSMRKTALLFILFFFCAQALGARSSGWSVFVSLSVRKRVFVLLVWMTYLRDGVWRAFVETI